MATTAILGVQATLLVAAGLLIWLLASASRRRFADRYFHSQLAQHPFAWGLVLVVVGAWVAALAVGVFRRRGWATVGVYVTETLLAIAGLLRFRPVRSLVDVFLAAAVVVLVATDDEPEPAT